MPADRPPRNIYGELWRTVNSWRSPGGQPDHPAPAQERHRDLGGEPQHGYHVGGDRTCFHQDYGFIVLSKLCLIS